MFYSKTGSRCTLLTLPLAALALALALPPKASADDSIDTVSVNLAWNPNPEPDIAGYKVYMRAFNTTYGAGTDVGNVTATSVPNLVPGNVYLFRVTAYNASGFESAPS